MTANEARELLASYGISRYTRDKAVQAAEQGGYYGIEMSNGTLYQVRFSDSSFSVTIK